MTLLRLRMLPALLLTAVSAFALSAAASAQELKIENDTSAQAQTISVSLAQLEAMPQVKLTTYDLHTHSNVTFEGVPLPELLQKVGVPEGEAFRGKIVRDYVVATGSDGYEAVLALAELEPSFHPGMVLVADREDGKPLDAAMGPFRLVVTLDQRPVRWVRNLASVTVKQAP